MHGPKTLVSLFAYGGVDHETVGCLVRDIGYAAAMYGEAKQQTALRKLMGVDGVPAWDVKFSIAPQDALIERARAFAAKVFLQTDAECLIMLDHDLAWNPACSGYEGDLCFIARMAAERQGIVGAMVSKKVVGEGIASMFKAEGVVPIGEEAGERCDPAWFVGAAFTAYHRSVIEDVSAQIEEIPPGYKPIFQTCKVPHPYDPTKELHLSEDWALCHRARECGHESWLALRPHVRHFGRTSFDVVSAQPPGAPASPACTMAPRMDPTHTEPVRLASISCIHATRGRPERATEASRMWIARANHPERVEMITSIDSDDVTMTLLEPRYQRVSGRSRGCVDAYNRGAYASKGQVLVQVHDDLEPPQGWDDAIVRAIGDVERPCLLRVNDGLSVNDAKPYLVPIAIVTRAFAMELGGMFHPDYVSVFCDDDMSMFSAKRGWTVDARDLLFAHHWEGPGRDETQLRSYSTENWKAGEKLFAERTVAGFPSARERWGK